MRSGNAVIIVDTAANAERLRLVLRELAKEAQEILSDVKTGANGIFDDPAERTVR